MSLKNLKKKVAKMTNNRLFKFIIIIFCIGFFPAVFINLFLKYEIPMANSTEYKNFKNTNRIPFVGPYDQKLIKHMLLEREGKARQLYQIEDCSRLSLFNITISDTCQNRRIKYTTIPIVFNF